MTALKYIPQTELPKSLRETLPTMYDLPSEDPEEPGLPDIFHYYQPSLLTETFIPPDWPAEQIFTAGDVNLYYDVNHFNWYKRPDWYAVLGTPRLYEGRDLRLSYVIWQEGVRPSMIVELLSPGTEKEDLGQTVRRLNNPPTKWEVYERILQIPYYVVYNRYTTELQIFVLNGSRYQEAELKDKKLWMPDIKLGIGLWQGSHREIETTWLRFYGEEGQWIPTLEEQVRQKTSKLEQETQRVERETQRAEQEAQRAERETQRAERETQRAEQETQRAEREAQRAEREAQRAERETQKAEEERQRAEKLAAKLRELGIDL